jgi:hypothetical protein
VWWQPDGAQRHLPQVQCLWRDDRLQLIGFNC